MKRVICAEWMKYRRSPVWLAFVLLPVLAGGLGTANFLGNQGLLDMAWEPLWTQHTLFSSMFFLPALLGTCCAWAWRLEHTGSSWNLFMTMPVPVWQLYAGKLIIMAMVSAGIQLWTGLIYLAAGKAVGLPGLGPGALAEWLVLGWVGSVAVCAGQLLLSLVIRAFAVPVAMALAGGIAGMLLTAKGWGYCFPYALMGLGMRANNPALPISLGTFLLAAGGYTLLFSGAAVAWLRLRDVKTG